MSIIATHLDSPGGASFPSRGWAINLGLDGQGADPPAPRSIERPVATSPFEGVTHLLLIDFEYTCWPESMRTGWADPTRPPEILEVGLVACALDGAGALATFTEIVRPRLNPQLSRYCRELLGIDQAEVDRSAGLPDVVTRIVAWQRGLPLAGAPTVGWGDDRILVTQDVARCGCPDPFACRPHIDLSTAFGQLVGRQSVARDEARRIWRLGTIVGRHRALADALDLVQFCRHLRQIVHG
jgi:inhibitor of KinA sporulation pathway (predicted exonuclease)